MSDRFLLLRLLLTLLCFLLLAQAQQQRLRLPPGYNMRLAAVPTRFVGKGAYSLAGKRAPPTATPVQWQQQNLHPQLHQRQQLYKWATMGGKKYN